MSGKKNSNLLKIAACEIMLCLLAYVILTLVVAVLSYDGIIRVEYLKIANSVIIITASCIALIVSKKIFIDEYNHLATIISIGFIAVITIIFLLCQQGSGADVNCALMSVLFTGAGAIIPSVIKTKSHSAHRKSKHKKRH